ncbi:MmcQ/YjbR family DNA-binding protein [Yersinia kristensenii]|uniref:MmcQ/YjbR family DNA-binding protein n=1 Tax=Yersinia kristensenii TaxID=28152 RepID=UPI001E2B38F1|nr:MmcQ/YjbR family DNA-binding protein [Yersinia kristensenii]MDA5473113.1 MmcQ/YjbR family DNA-binding protein [Yersinia kristensenii]MDA5478247.1 MmcQ/YjbR family DNA-binding protein [Yersinia kristensenii]MDA5505767.1 MmcQ/YjbR family DNA-binding protein [Yersinia kristensenii]MDA5523012.1 MmcQ/YjbR family DNA-binding protein [Yersinia kristensenii]
MLAATLCRTIKPKQKLTWHRGWPSPTFAIDFQIIKFLASHQPLKFNHNSEVTMLLLFKNKKAVPQRLLNYGFTECGDDYHYSTRLLDGQFEMVITVSKLEHVSATLTDTGSNEEYVLHLVPGSCGAFVGRVRAEYGKVLSDIAQKCFESDIFKSEQAQAVIQYIRSKYGDELEFLWAKFPTNAIWRRADNAKWYGALLLIPKNKLGVNDSALCDVLNLRANPEIVAELIDNKRYFRAYHMNKKHWLSLCLDGSLSLEELYLRIDHSYALAAKK